MAQFCSILLHLFGFIVLVYGVTIEPIGDWEIIWNWQTAKCTNQTTPDQPARAFKLSNGDIEFLDGDNYGIYQMRGPNLDNLTSICDKPIINSGDDGPYAVPSEYNNSFWIESVWRNDKNPNIVYGIVHNEFHGERQSNKTLCPSGTETKCGYWNALCSISNDGGNTFKLYDDINTRTCIVSPFEYIPDGGTQGYGRISNILHNPINDGYYYLWIRRHSPNPIGVGVCLWRSNDLSDPNSWRGWNGTSNAFDVESVDPYLQANNNHFKPNEHVCDISQSLPDYFARSWTFNNILNMYIQVGINVNSGFIEYSYSENIFNWSKPQNLVASNFTNGLHKVIYPVLLDESSIGVNFEYTNEYPWLYLVRGENITVHPPARDIIRIKLKVSL